MSQNKHDMPAGHEQCANNGHTAVHLFSFYCSHQRRWDGWAHLVEEDGDDMRTESFRLDFSPFWTEEEVLKAIGWRLESLMTTARKRALESDLLDGPSPESHDGVALRLFDLPSTTGLPRTNRG